MFPQDMENLIERVLLVGGDEFASLIREGRVEGEGEIDLRIIPCESFDGGDDPNGRDAETSLRHAKEIF